MSTASARAIPLAGLALQAESVRGRESPCR